MRYSWLLALGFIVVTFADVFIWPETNQVIINEAHDQTEHVIVINGKDVYSLLPTNGVSSFDLAGLDLGKHVIVAYSYEKEQLVKLGDVQVEITERKQSQKSSPKVLKTSVQISQVGILYEVWHTAAATAMANITAEGGIQLSVEDVIQSNGNYLLSDVYDKYDQADIAMDFYYQDTPQLGYYCIYKNRDGQSSGYPDCKNIQATLGNHAKDLISAGVDYIVVDASHYGTNDSTADLLQQRPIEVLFEEWYNLRQSGQNTPRIAVWQTIPKDSNLWECQLNLYNNQTYQDLIFKDPNTGKKVFFYRSDNADSDILSQIQSNGGKNDILCVGMWALYSPSGYSDGNWTFMSPCTFNGSYTTSIITLPECNQYETTGGPLGPSLTISPSYQYNYSSLPFSAAGQYGGLTFKKQWNRAFVLNPFYVFLSSWNEWISTPASNPYDSDYAFDWGLPKDPNNNDLFIDNYGATISRDIEPSTTQSTLLYDILSSCMRVYRMRNAGYHIIKNSLSASCTVDGEICCESDEEKEGFINIWSMVAIDDNPDRLLSNSWDEVKNLQNSGGWKQVCNPYPGPSDFCYDPNELDNYDSVRGPFLLFNKDAQDRIALYRCLTEDLRHFFSLDPNCESKTVEGLLGYMGKNRCSVTPRSLWRCKHDNDTWYPALDYSCGDGDTDEGHYGFVH